MMRPVGRTGDGLLKALGKEFTAARNTAPHFQKGAPREVLRPHFCLVGEHALFYLGDLNFEKPHRLPLRDDDAPHLLVEVNPIASDRAVASGELAERLRRSCRFRRGEQ